MGYLFILKDSSTVAFPYAKSQNKWPQICVLSENRLGWILPLVHFLFWLGYFDYSQDFQVRQAVHIMH